MNTQIGIYIQTDRSMDKDIWKNASTHTDYTYTSLEHTYKQINVHIYETTKTDKQRYR